MTDAPLHRLYRHYSELPYSQRVLYTATLLILGMAYLFALINLYHTYAGGPGGNPMMMTYQDFVVAYSGSGQGLAARIGAARTDVEHAAAGRGRRPHHWVEGGADRAKYESEVRPLLEKRCMICHDGSNPHLRNLNGYDNLKKVAERDTGTDVFTLVRVSHIHLFGLTFVFFIMGLMYSHAYVRPVWFKCAIIALPYVAIAMDVSSWYFTKLFHPFAWVVIVSGGIMGACFAFMWAVTMYQMWLAPPPAMVAARVGGEIAIDG